MPGELMGCWCMGELMTEKWEPRPFMGEPRPLMDECSPDGPMEDGLSSAGCMDRWDEGEFKWPDESEETKTEREKK